MVDRVDDVFDQLLQIIGAAIGECTFGERPDPFIGVELRCVGRKVLEMQTAMLSEKSLQWLSLVGGGVIQQDDHRAPQGAQQAAQKQADLLLPDIVEVELGVQAQTLLLGAYRDSRNDRDLVASSLPVIVNRSAALWRPGLGHMRNQQETRFVSENQVGTQPRSVFFMRGQSFCCQRTMACSSLSRARRSGICGLHCRLCINPPTWSRWYWIRDWRRINSAMRAVVHRLVR